MHPGRPTFALSRARLRASALERVVRPHCSHTQIRVSTAIQFTSQVLPPSAENDCSNRQEFDVMSEMTNRTRIVRPLRVSWLKNSPRSFVNWPMAGGLIEPLPRPEKFKLHCRDCGLYRRRFSPSKCPAGPSTTSSTRLARPFQTFLTTVVPSYSTHVVEPVRGRSKRLKCVFHVPKWKSKSCWPSRCSDMAEPRLSASVCEIQRVLGRRESERTTEQRFA